MPSRNAHGIALGRAARPRPHIYATDAKKRATGHATGPLDGVLNSRNEHDRRARSPNRRQAREYLLHPV